MSKYDVVLSFAGQDRQHAKALADLLKTGGYSFFYDENERAHLWGKDLYVHLSSVYKDQGHYCVMFLSEHYARNLWTNHERKSAQARAFRENREYILPVRLDDTEIPGILPTVGYLDLRSMTIGEIYEDLVKKLSGTTSKTTTTDKGDSSQTNKPLRGFVTYSHQDTEAKNELRKRLAVMEQQNELVTWDDGQLTPGDKALQKDILKKVVDLDILLYLVSAASLASKNCNKELAEALKQEIRVIPIILEHCDWLHHQLSGFEVLPDKGKPISKWVDPSEGWQNVVEGIRKAIDEMQAQTDPWSGTPERERHAKLAFQYGNPLMMLEQWDMAIKEYSNAIDLNPHNAEAYNNRGEAYQKKGEFDKAIEDYETAIGLNRDYVLAYNNLGNVYSAKGEFGRALHRYNMAIVLAPKSPYAYNGRGIVYREMDNLDQAIKDYKTAIELRPDSPLIYNNRGVAYRRKGEYDRAIEDFDKAIELRPDFEWPYSNRGLAYKDKGEYNRAIKDFDKAIEVNPQYSDGYRNRGNVYFHKGNFARAVEDYNKAIELKEDNDEVYNNRAEAYLHLEKWREAIADLKTAKAMGADIIGSFHNNYEGVEDFKQKTGIQLPEDISALLTPHSSEAADAYIHIARGIDYKENGNYDLAIASFHRAIALDPDAVQAYYNRGVAYYYKGRFYRALDDFSKVISLTPDDTFAYVRRGMAYRNLLVFEKAIQDFSTAIPLKPEAAADAYKERGVTYHSKGDIDKAIEDYNAAIALDPGFAEAWTERGKAYQNKGEIDKAIDNYNKAIELNPELAEPYTYRGLIYNQQSELDKAIADHSKAIACNPEFAEACVNRGQTYYAKNELDTAIADYDKAIQLKPELVEAYTHRGNAYRAKAELDSAIADYTEALKLRPKIAEFYYTRGEAWLFTKGWEEAKTDLMAALLQDVDVAAAFHSTHGSIAAFEEKIGSRLPKEIVVLLTPQSEPFEMDKDARIALGMKYYGNDELSSGLASKLAGIPRVEFILLMGNYGLSPFGPDEDEYAKSGF